MRSPSRANPSFLPLHAALALGLLLAARANAQPVVQWWASTENMDHKLSPQPDLAFGSGPTDAKQTIQVDAGTTYQSILGLGSSLEHSTCHNLGLLPDDRREKAVESIVHPTRGIGMNLMRICIGTPDFTPSPWYTYNDLPAGQTDPEMKHFSIAKDREYVLPILKLARKINPELRFFASPWSPPAWMKTNGGIGGGQIDPDHFRSYAEYLARFVETYRDEGIEVHAITVQNEPEYAPGTYPTCRWTAEQQRDFIRDHLGPVFKARRLATLIWCFDHNFNNPGFPATILRDPRAAAFVDGSAFHAYEGKPEAMSKLHREFPDKHIYFTEGSTFGVRGAGQIVSFLRNGSRSYNAWVTLIDHRGKPNRGPHDCSPTCIVVNSETLQLDYRFDYYMYGQFMKFIRPGAVRVASSASSTLPPNVALRNPDGSLVLIAVNTRGRPQPVDVGWSGRSFSVTLPAKSVATFRWLP